MITRRNFVKNSALAAALTSLPTGIALAGSDLKKITILHTNDQHSRIEPFEISSDERYSNKGGFARRSAMIEKIRTEEKNVLLLDAGDIFQGTPYFNFFGGELEFKLMSQMKYDLATIGNHDFDAGMDGLKKQLPHADFDFVSANYDFTNTVLEGLFQPYKIIRKDGLKIGIFGLGIELAGLVGKEYYKETKYLDPVEMARVVTQKLKEKNCDLIICLSHLGFDYGEEDKISDVLLAERTQDIDLIIGGHTHTFLKAPVEKLNAAGKTVLINQVGWAGLYLGRIDFWLDKNRRVKEYTTHSIGVDASVIV